MTTIPIHLEEAIEAWLDAGLDVAVHYNGGSFMGEIVLSEVSIIDGWLTGTRRGTAKEVWINLAQVTWVEEA